MPADYHTHTAFSDGRGGPAELVRRARDLGLSELGICDHLLPASVEDDYGIPRGRLREYAESVRAAAAGSSVTVLLGVEVDYVPGTVEEMGALLTECRPDYVVGSVHEVDGLAFDDPVSRDRLDDADLRMLWAGYFTLMREAAVCGLFDVLGHFDLIKKFGRRPPLDRSVVAAARKALAAAAETGVALELNTAGWRHPVGEQYPSLALLRHARELGVPLTFGSDAHSPADVGSGFVEAVELAKGAGYATWLRLSDRSEVPLP